MLVLSLTKDTYQTLGLVGRPSRFSYGSSGRAGDRNSGPMSRYSTSLLTVVELPLLAPSFVPGKRGYDRALYCLREWDYKRSQGTNEPSWTVLMAWTPPENTQGGSHVAPIKVPSPCSLRPLPITVATQRVTDAWVPQWSDVMSDESSLEMLEWCGLAILESPMLRTFNEQIAQTASYLPPPSTAGEYVHIRLRGFIPPQVAAHVALVAHQWTMKERTWSFVSTTGFADAPIAWQSAHPGVGLALGSGKSVIPGDEAKRKCSRNKIHNKGYMRPGETEHGILRTGENGWCTLLLPSGRVMYYESMELDTRN